MKVLLYTSKVKDIEKSGIGKASMHQQKALKLAGVSYTLNPKDDYDIIHINSIFPDSLLMAKKAKQKGKKVVFHAHSTEEDFKNSFKFSNFASKPFKQWIKLCYSTADILLTPTPYSKGVLETYGLNKEIIAVSNGIDLNFWKADENAKQRFRNKYNFKEEDKVIMAVGLYIERKGILEFLELAKRMPEYKFIWFGYTAPSLRTFKVSEAIKNKTDNVYFPGYVTSNELKDAYAGSDIYIFPTKEETEGIVLLEALAMQINTIINDIPIYDSLTDGYNIYKAKNIDEFETKIKKLFNGSLPSVTKNGYKIAADRDIKMIGYKLKKIYEKVIEKDLIR